MNGNFNRAFDFVIGVEGNYSDDPHDPGGATKYGISKRAFPDLDIKNLTLDHAKEIYLISYWNKINADALPFPMDIFAFDVAVNQGPGRAAKLLEQSQSPCQFLMERVCTYADLADKNPVMRAYFRGWINRTVKLYRDFKEG